ncbi:hypothetical protein PINS_up007867 [Pythium insidiosum]|nr:hypothetical protein PINS_up007867 [Pythium insidiosum]
MEDDERRQYVLSLLQCMWGPHVTLSSAKASETALTSFLEDPQCSVLLARLVDAKRSDDQAKTSSGGDTITLSNQLHDDSNNNSDASSSSSAAAAVAASTTTGGEMVFVKLRPLPLTPQTMRTNLHVTTLLPSSPLLSLYQSVHQVYAPLLLRNDDKASQLSQKLKDVLLELDNGLGSTVLGLGTASSGSSGSSSSSSSSHLKAPAPLDEGSAAALMGIVSITDEFQYWERGDHRNVKRARKFSASFDNIQQRFSQLATLSVDDMSELLEETANTLDDIWRADLARDHQFPQARMDHVLGLVGSAINTFIVEKARALDLWTGSFHDVSALLQQAIALCDKWSVSVESLTATMWPSYDEHPWTGPRSTQDAPLQSLVRRMEDVLRVRTTYEELTSLLPRADAGELATTCFAPFRALQPLFYNPYTDAKWQAAVRAYERELAPVESRVGALLREQIGAVASKPGAAVRLLQRYRHLLQRPSLAKALAAERDAMLAQLLAHLDQLESDFEARRHSGSSSSSSSKEKALHIGKTLSPKVNLIVWGHMLSGRVGDMLALARAVLADLPGFKPFGHRAEQLLTKVNGLVLDKVRDWQDEIEQQLDADGEHALRLSGRLMQIDKRGDLVVNYSEFLVTLLRDVRQLTELAAQHSLQQQLQQQQLHSNGGGGGSSSSGKLESDWVPPRVRKVADEAEKYYRFGVTLKKVANFYNNMESQIIEEQKPMLLDSLLAFEEVVQRPGAGSSNSAKSPTKRTDVTWQNLEECNDYVKQLQDAADKLAAENRRFKRAHEKLSEELVALMDVDLLRHPTRWKERWDDIKKNVLAVTKRVDPARTKKWFLFWDHQLYKVLESGYQLGLEMLNENLPEIKEIRTELQFPTSSSGGGAATLALKPPIEELRTTYYKAMKRFVARPTKFGGFANPQVFAAMCDHNATNLVAVYQTCEQLFSRVEALVVEYEPWSVLARLAGGGAELDTLLETTLQEPAGLGAQLQNAQGEAQGD